MNVLHAIISLSRLYVGERFEEMLHKKGEEKMFKKARKVWEGMLYVNNKLYERYK